MATATRAKKTGAKRKSAPRPIALKNMIGGKFVAPVEGKREDVVNPATGDVIARAPLSTKKDVDAAVGAAKEAFETWGTTTPAERSGMLLKLADAIEENA